MALFDGRAIVKLQNKSHFRSFFFEVFWIIRTMYIDEKSLKEITTKITTATTTTTILTTATMITITLAFNEKTQ